MHTQINNAIFFFQWIPRNISAEYECACGKLRDRKEISGRNNAAKFLMPNDKSNRGRKFGPSSYGIKANRLTLSDPNSWKCHFKWTGMNFCFTINTLVRWIFGIRFLFFHSSVDCCSTHFFECITWSRLHLTFAHRYINFKRKNRFCHRARVSCKKNSLNNIIIIISFCDWAPDKSSLCMIHFK